MSEELETNERPYKDMSDEDIRASINEQETTEEVRRNLIEELKLRSKILKFITKNEKLSNKRTD